MGKVVWMSMHGVVVEVGIDVSSRDMPPQGKVISCAHGDT